MRASRYIARRARRPCCASRGPHRARAAPPATTPWTPARGRRGRCTSRTRARTRAGRERRAPAPASSIQAGDRLTTQQEDQQHAGAHLGPPPQAGKHSAYVQGAVAGAVPAGVPCTPRTPRARPTRSPFGPSRLASGCPETGRVTETGSASVRGGFRRSLQEHGPRLEGAWR